MQIYFIFLLFVALQSTGMRNENEPLPSNIIILQGGEVYNPTYIGIKDIMLSGNEIVSITDRISDSLINELRSIALVNVYNLSGLRVCPGFVDSHVHLTGGGGEIGPESRTPEAQLSEIILAGITTAIGVLGTDSVTRSLPNLLAKVKGFTNEGLSCYMLSGGYRVPPPLLTTSPMNDLILISEVIGLGELAISDYRSSVPSFDELARISSDCKIGGLLSKKGGVVHVHVGKGAGGLKPLWEIVQNTEVPITLFHPTHLSSRTQELLNDAKNWVKAGGYADFTAEGEEENNTAISALIQFQSEGLNMNQVTISSDAYGSFPFTDEFGNIIRYGVGKPDTLIYMIKTLVLQHGWSMESALQLITRNVAKIYLLTKKGTISVGNDGDLLVLSQDFKIEYVFAKGKEMKTPQWVKKGMFEP